MDIAVIGTGYVGLVTAACFANVGHNVRCVDNDKKKIQMLKNGKIPIHEPGLDKLVSENTKKNTLQFFDEPKNAIKKSDVIFVAVGTPQQKDGKPNLKYVVSVAKTIAKYMDTPKIIVNKSTVPVGTADMVKKTIKDEQKKHKRICEFSVCSNPEFLKEGNAIDDFNKPARIIIGTDDENTKEVMRQCYAPFSRNHDKIIFMDVKSAELTKYAANTMLATKISFINEIANIAEKVGADIENVRIGIGSDPRIGYDFIYPGAGYGGSCFPKDVRALTHIATNAKVKPRVLVAVEEVNQKQKNSLVVKLKKEIGGSLKGKTIAVWGLAFKPNTDDMREAPSLTLIQKLKQEGAKIKAFDPVAKPNKNEVQIVLAKSKEDATKNADALVICTEWEEFRVIDFELLAKNMKSKLIIDGRNIVDIKQAEDEGFVCIGVGRRTKKIKKRQITKR